MQITTYTAKNDALFDVVTLQNASNINQLFERVLTASATTRDVALFVARIGDKLTRSELKTVAYANARARYRENRDLSLDDLIMLAHVSRKQVMQHLRMLRLAAQERFTANEVSRVLCRIAD
jgi:hypothetical protein